MRGEKDKKLTQLQKARGSPPHARGKVVLAARSLTIDGITPACAGKSAIIPYIVVADKDHPRMRGEKFSLSSLIFASQGSPPHARGKVPICGIHNAYWGITPACAGKRQFLPGHSLERWDHPRMRGEKGPITN